MKNKILLLIFVLIAFSACYDDYIEDFDYDAIYIPFQNDVRTFVVGEGMKFNLGVELGGVRNNSRDRIVRYEIDNSLITPEALARLKGGQAYVSAACANVTNLLPLPANYYSLTDGEKFIIKKGNHIGLVTVNPDSAKFLSDPSTILPVYALGIRIITADADTVIKSKSTAVIGVKFENMLFGSYWHGGVTMVKDPADANVIDTITYYTQIPVSEAKVWSLKTASPQSVSASGYSDINSPTGNEFILTLNDANIVVSSSSKGKYNMQPDGQSTFNKAKLLQNRRIYLNYKYQDASGNWYHAKDTLTFRNRMRDGVNEWQDEDPSHY